MVELIDNGIPATCPPVVAPQLIPVPAANPGISITGVDPSGVTCVTAWPTAVYK